MGWGGDSQIHTRYRASRLCYVKTHTSIVTYYKYCQISCNILMQQSSVQISTMLSSSCTYFWNLEAMDSGNEAGKFVHALWYPQCLWSNPAELRRMQKYMYKESAHFNDLPRFRIHYSFSLILSIRSLTCNLQLNKVMQKLWDPCLTKELISTSDLLME